MKFFYCYHIRFAVYFLFFDGVTIIPVLLQVLQVVRYIMQQIDDIHTLHYLVTTLPSNTERTAWLRNVLAYMALMTRLDKTLTIAEHEQEIKSNGVQVSWSFICI